MDWYKQANTTRVASNGATWNGRPFWSGAVDLVSGQIMEVHPYEKAQQSDFHHSFYFSQRAIDEMRAERWGFFWVENGQVNGMWRIQIDDPVIRKIESQIQGVTPRPASPPKQQPSTVDEVYRQDAAKPHPGD
jgi:hypothetical protein